MKTLSMETSEIRKKLHDYIESAKEEKVKSIYTVLENEINMMFSHWDDPEFMAEMDSRMQELENGTVKAISMEEMFAQMDKHLKILRSKHAV